MNKLAIFSISLCILMVGVWTAHAAPTNFGGTWVLDKQKSERMQGPMANLDITLAVTQDEKQLTVVSKYSGGEQEIPPQTSTYHLDGSETTAEYTGFMTGKGTLKAKWLDEGKTLELHSVRTVSFQGNEGTITITERWTLAEGGKVLQVQRSVEFPGGTRESKLVFNKK